MSDLGYSGMSEENYSDKEWLMVQNHAKLVAYLEAENAELKKLIGYCITDMYKPSGKISKPTAIKLMKYMSDNNLLKH